MVVCPDETGAVDSQDAVPNGEPAVGGRGAVLDQSADVDPRGAERSVLLAGKGGERPARAEGTHRRVVVPKG